MRTSENVAWGIACTLFVALSFTVTDSSRAQTQTWQCGDVDHDGAPCFIKDGEALKSLLRSGGIVDSMVADVDARPGITIADGIMILDVFYWFYNQFPACNFNAGPYSYTIQLTDTVFIPRWQNIQADMDSVAAPVVTSYDGWLVDSPAVQFPWEYIYGTYIPFRPLGPESTNEFEISADFSPILGDTSVIVAYHFGKYFLGNDSIYVRHRKVITTLTYHRISNGGSANIEPECVPSISGRRQGVARFGDETDPYSRFPNMYTPVVVFYDADICARGISGNVDNDSADLIDISDLTALIDHLYLSMLPLPCPAEANTDANYPRSIDISDLTALIDHLYISFAPLPPAM